MPPFDDLDPLPTIEAEEPAPRTLLLRLRGELDEPATTQLNIVIDDELRNVECRRILVDLSRVTLLSSAGLRALQQLRRRCRVHKMHLVLIGTSRPAVHRPLRITGLLALFDTRPTVQAALHGHLPPRRAGDTGGAAGRSTARIDVPG
jgi:anti-anti-sigma factor